MALKLRFLRAATAGNRPVSLEPGQVFLDEFEGKFFVRNPAGGIHEAGVLPTGMASETFVTAAINALSFSSLAGFSEADVALLSAANFTASPTAPTPTAGDSTTKVATTAFVSAEVASGVANLVGGSPEAYNTLQEIFTLAQSNSDAQTALATGQTNKCDKANNLSDLADAPTARTNLGLGDLATLNIANLVLDEGTV